MTAADPAPTIVQVVARSYELDPYGHVNHAVYVNWLEHGRSAWLAARGTSFQKIPGEFGVHVLIVRLAVDFRAEIRQDDRMVVSTRLERVGSSSFTFAQRIDHAGGPVAAEAAAVMVAARDGRAVPIPPAFRTLLEAPPRG